MTMDHTRPDPGTTDAEEAEAAAPHTADRPPSEEEEAAAEQNEVDPSVAEHFEEAARRGAEVEGEGSIP